MTEIKEKKKRREQNYSIEREYLSQVPFEDIVERILRYHMEKLKYVGADREAK